MKRHLETCPQRIQYDEPGDIAQHEQARKVFHLLVEETYPPVYYWMYLAITPETTLATLDQFLRDIWLECCGHLSAFEIAGTRYCVDDALYDWAKNQKDMRVRLDDVLHSDQTCTYEYDFGSTTKLRLKVLSEHETLQAGKAIQAIARNDLSFVACQECGDPATFTCDICRQGNAGWLCDACARKHACNEELLRPRVNSPREGVCGYVGPSRARTF
jgi:hypothetical protein